MKEEKPQEEENEGKGSIEEMVTPPNEGELLVVKRVFLASKGLKKNPKKTLFTSKKKRPLSLPP